MHVCFNIVHSSAVCITNTIARNFRWVKFCYQALKAYFRGLIFVVCPEHVIIVLSLLSRFSWVNFFVLGLSITNPTKISRYTVYVVIIFCTLCV